MPNWCENELTIAGNTEYVDKVLEFIKTEESCFSFNTLIPYPEEYRKLDRIAAEWQREANKKREAGEEVNWSERPKDGYNQGGYGWCVSNWGTKWDACNAEITDIESGSEDYKVVHFIFDTAWSPPEPVIEALAKKFPKLDRVKLNYYEGGCCFHGYVEYENGELFSEACGDYYGSRGG